MTATGVKAVRRWFVVWGAFEGGLLGLLGGVGALGSRLRTGFQQSLPGQGP